MSKKPSKKERAKAFAASLMDEKKLDLLSSLKKDRQRAVSEAEKTKALNQSLETLIEALEKENDELTLRRERYQREIQDLKESLIIMKERNRALQKKVNDRTEALLKIDKEKNDLLYKINQEQWLREEAEIKARDLERENDKLVIAQEHESSAMSALLGDFEQENEEYEKTMQNFKGLLGTKKEGLRLKTPKPLHKKIRNN